MENSESPGRGFSPFGRAALDAGLLPTMKSIIATANHGDYYVLSIYYGIDTLTRLCKTGTLEQKCTLSKQILEHDVLTVIYDVRIVSYSVRPSNRNPVPQRLQDHPYFIVRIVAAEFLATMARESNYFGVQPDVEVIAEMIFNCCRACLVGPDQAEEEMKDPSRRWTTRHVWEGQRRVSSPPRENLGSPDSLSIYCQMTVREAANYAPRRYGFLQENVFYSVMDLVAPLPVRKKAAVLEILRKRPQILQQLLTIASETRPPWYPETEVYSIAAECFTSLLNLPMDRVPGVSVSVEGGLQREIDEEWTAALEILRMVTAIPAWVNKVYAVWDRVESESWVAIKV